MNIWESFYQVPQYQLLVLLAKKYSCRRSPTPAIFFRPSLFPETRGMSVLKTNTYWKLKCLENMNIEDDNKVTIKQFGYSRLSFDVLCWVLWVFQYEFLEKKVMDQMGIPMMVKISATNTYSNPHSSNLSSLKKLWLKYTMLGISTPTVNGSKIWPIFFERYDEKVAHKSLSFCEGPQTQRWLFFENLDSLPKPPTCSYRHS